MEFKKFFDILRKHRLPLVLIPIAVMIITFILTKNKPNVYSSNARISAGLVDQTQKLFLNKDEQVENKVNQSFTNIIQILQSKAVIEQVSYLLILNDLTTNTPFRKPSKLLLELNAVARKHAVEVYTKMYNNHQALSMVDPDQKGLYKVLVSMKFDFETIKSKYKVFRVENSDFIDLYYDSENPLLSAFVVNAICKEFVAYFTSITKQNELKALNFVRDLMIMKKDSLDIKTMNLMNYKIKNRILNLNEQTRSLYGQLSDFQTRLKVAKNEVEANTGAIEAINRKLGKNEKQYFEAKMSIANKDIVKAREKLNALNDEYIKSNFNNAIKQKIDSQRAKIADKINHATDKYITNPLVSKDNLIGQKLKMEIDMSMAENIIKSLTSEIEILNQKLDSLVPNEAMIQSMESDINVASQEYVEILKKFNQISLEYNSAVRIKQIESGSPEDAQPSKKILIVILSGVICFVVYFIVIFVLFYLDTSIKLPEELEKATEISVLGFFPIIKSSFLEIQKVWDNDAISDVEKEFRNLLRSARFEIYNALKNKRILAVTSLKKNEGKTLFVLSLASAYQMIGKKVLIIDGNFLNPEITRIANAEYYVEDYLSGNISLEQSSNNRNMKILGNKGADTTLFEINNEDWIKQKLEALKDFYDIVIIETSSLDTLNESKEWIEVSESVLAIFESNQSISHAMNEKIGYLKNLDDKFIGWVLNRVTSYTYKVTLGNKAL